MTTTHIVCTHDAVPVAENLMRLLTAEEHDVTLSFGRHSLSELDAARDAREAVLLIWSYDAPGAHYMHEWARAIDPSRLVEISRAPGAARIDRRAPVIDFSNWRGERGGRAWHALTERLRAVSRVLEPPKPQPVRAAMALGLVSVAAVSGAALVRVQDTAVPNVIAEIEPIVSSAAAAEYDPHEGVGGALQVVEPASEEAATLVRVRRFRMQQIAAIEFEALAPVPTYDAPQLRDATLLERITALNPLPVINQLRRGDNDDG